jgi:phosphoribosyl-AMP cyclohydrolase
VNRNPPNHKLAGRVESCRPERAATTGETSTVSDSATGPDFGRVELIPAIAQDAATGDVLMMAWMNREAWDETLRTGRACYYSRSRQKLWRKGEESGNVQQIHEIYFDCDADTILLKVQQIGGAACHEGYASCFFRRFDPETGKIETVGERVFDPASVYRKDQ